ncbi:hypothetical protein Q0N48_03730 [Corynebacterium ureicelerivorans]|uniref:hypothetical protein n=1 Tax=Corynebacterium ureicelerivorans TaxID=401472 RepID=UPI00264D1CE1|nr:hypothetical protein [Corynebacterium ureicelerivorans]MDN8605120.1 hypothetical protein [Corynebacterium ureicelerivorans]
MKKPMLSLGVAAAVTTSAVVAPAAFSQDGESDGQMSSQALAEGAGGSSLSTGEILGTTLGVLAAVGVAGVFAVQQGWVQLPKFVDRATVERLVALLPPMPIPGVVRPGPAGGAGAKGSCAPQAFDAVVPGWPHFTGTSVIFCDGHWAIAGANQTDWVLYFKNANGKWAVIPAAGTKQTGLAQGCYNDVTLREQGAPEEFIRRAPICTPAEIGR